MLNIYSRPLPTSVAGRRGPWLATLAVLALFALPAGAQTGLGLGVLGGVGGSPDSDSFTGANFYAMASWEWRLHTFAQVRIGQLGVDFDTGLGALQSADLTWIGVSTEYRYDADYYDSGYVIGIGYYQLESDFLLVPGSAVFASRDEDAIGLHLGVTGDFRLSHRWSIPVEVIGHYADFDQAQIFLTASAGIRFTF